MLERNVLELVVSRADRKLHYAAAPATWEVCIK